MIYIKNKKDNVLVVLFGYGLGDIFNFSIYVLPELKKKYNKVVIISENSYDIFEYFKNIIYIKIKQKKLLHALKEVVPKYCIKNVLYPDNHEEIIAILKEMKIDFVSPDRKFINSIINSEKGFYFNIIIKIFRKIDNLSVELKKLNKKFQFFFGEKEKKKYDIFIRDKKVNNNLLNVLIIPFSDKKIKSLSIENLKKVIKKIKIDNKINIFVISNKSDIKNEFDEKIYFLNNFSCNEIFYFISKTDFCISVDTGFIHVAQYYNKKIIGLFGPTNKKNSLLSDDILEFNNLILNKQCKYRDRIVYKNSCVKNDYCNHQ